MSVDEIFRITIESWNNVEEFTINEAAALWSGNSPSPTWSCNSDKLVSDDITTGFSKSNLFEKIRWDLRNGVYLWEIKREFGKRVVYTLQDQEKLIKHGTAGFEDYEHVPEKLTKSQIIEIKDLLISLMSEMKNPLRSFIEPITRRRSFLMPEGKTIEEWITNYRNQDYSAPDPQDTRIKRSELARYAMATKQTPVFLKSDIDKLRPFKDKDTLTPPFLDTRHAYHSEEIAIAIRTWLYFFDEENFRPNKAIKVQIEEYLRSNYKNLSSNAIERISTLTNPKKKGGAPSSTS